MTKFSTSTISQSRYVPELSERQYGYLLLAPVAILFVAVVVIPTAFAIWASFNAWDLYGGETTWVWLANYQHIFNEESFWESFRRGVVYALYSTVLQVVGGLVVALVINESFKFNNIVRSIALLPYLIPSIGAVLVLNWIFHSNFGILNYYLLQIGLIAEPIRFTADEALAMHTAVWVSSWKFTSFVVFLVLARLQSIHSEMYEIAKINGAGPIRRFFDVTLPNIKSTLMIAALLRLIFMFNNFDIIWPLTQGGPFEATNILVVYAYNQAFGTFQFGRAAATTTVMFLVLFVVGVIYFRVFKPEEEVEVA